jgi:hypothetical protein
VLLAWCVGEYVGDMVTEDLLSLLGLAACRGCPCVSPKARTKDANKYMMGVYVYNYLRFHRHDERLS